MFDRVTKLLEAQALIQTGLQPVLVSLKDTSLPLDERWQAFLDLVNNHILVNEEPYGDGFIEVLNPNKLTLYDHFNIDRGATLTYPDMYTTIMEADEFYPALVEGREQNLAKWQEAVLASGYSGFEYDW